MFLCQKVYIINKTITINQIFSYSNIIKNSFINYNNNNLNINPYKNLNRNIKSNLSLIIINSFLFQLLLFNNIQKNKDNLINYLIIKTNLLI